jgi:hypothetical protein
VIPWTAFTESIDCKADFPNGALGVEFCGMIFAREIAFCNPHLSDGDAVLVTAWNPHLNDPGVSLLDISFFGCDTAVFDSDTLLSIVCPPRVARRHRNDSVGTGEAGEQSGDISVGGVI